MFLCVFTWADIVCLNVAISVMQGSVYTANTRKCVHVCMGVCAQGGMIVGCDYARSHIAAPMKH